MYGLQHTSQRLSKSVGLVVVAAAEIAAHCLGASSPTSVCSPDFRHSFAQFTSSLASEFPLHMPRTCRHPKVHNQKQHSSTVSTAVYEPLATFKHLGNSDFNSKWVERLPSVCSTWPAGLLGQRECSHGRV